MIKLELYSKKECELLKSYYSDKVFDQIIEPDLKLKIVSFDIEQWGNNRYNFNCKGKLLTQQSIIPIINIKTVAGLLGLKLPQKIISESNRVEN
jgi:hypothetical protein